MIKNGISGQKHTLKSFSGLQKPWRRRGEKILIICQVSEWDADYQLFSGSIFIKVYRLLTDEVCSVYGTLAGCFVAMRTRVREG
jgi:hypothetical protein